MNVTVENDSTKSVRSITPSDTTDSTTALHNVHGLSVASAGDIVMQFKDGSQLTWAFGVGEIWKFQPLYVLLTGTTAAGIVGHNLYH